jgi:DNA-3-methyladenine glycosylase
MAPKSPTPKSEALRSEKTGRSSPESRVITRPFYNRPALEVARELLGQRLVRAVDGQVRVGIIVETEAYVGEHDLACHASKGRTPRTEVMFGPPGHAYVYLVYGMHHCFNAVTGPEGEAAAVLVRAVAPVAGLEGRTDGPGRLAKAFGFSRVHTGMDLCGGETLWLEEGEPVSSRRVARGPRVGVDYAGEWARQPYRRWVKDSPWVSRA